MTSGQLIGIGLRHPHYKEVLRQLPDIGWLEVHSENFLMEGGPVIDCLNSIAEKYPISLHGVNLSLGSKEGVDETHLERIQQLINWLNPFLVSEHLSWSEVNGVNVPDLLPVPYTREALKVFEQNIAKTQEFLSHEILIENPSSYIEFRETEYSEIEFLISLCRRTGAKILLDVNNVFVSCFNHGWDSKEYLDKIPPDLVKEIHIAGHTTKTLSNNQILRIDSHDNLVSDKVWQLYNYAIQKFGARPTLLEWDSSIPDLDSLIQEAKKAEKFMPTGEKENV